MSLTVSLALAILLAACGSDPSPLANDAQVAEEDAGSSPTDAGSSASCAEEPERSGEGTYYGADGTGNCSFDPSPDDLLVAAMNDPEYEGSAACGACAAVSGPSGEVTVRIVDRCPECAQGDLDLSPQAFERIAELSAGRVPIRWRYVPCEPPSALIYRFKEGSSQWWTGVQVRNHRHRIARFEYEREGAFVEVPRESYNYFVAAGGMGPGPYRFRITDVYGHSVEEAGVPLRDSGDAAGAAQLPVCGP